MVIRLTVIHPIYVSSCE